MTAATGENMLATAKGSV